MTALDYFDHEAERLSTWRRALVAMFRNILRIFPERRPTGSTLTITAPLFTLFADPVGAIDDITRGLSKFAVEPNDPTIRPGTRLGGAIIANVLAVSRLTFEEAQKRPYRLVWPSEAKVSPAELPATYLAGTPFEALLQTPVEIPIPSDLRTEHAIITATIGHGKTQLMQSIILGDLDDGAQPGIVVIDSQGDAIHTLSRLQRFDPAISDRLVILDPTDIQPPALNIFHWDRAFSAMLCERDREEYLAGVIELFHFIAGGLLGAELTARMSVVFRFISQLLVEIPNATIHDLIALLQDPSPYMQYIGRLPPTTQAFIEQLFDERSQYRQTRQHLLQRLYHVISNPAFERMFAHPKNKFDMRAALNDGKVVLINTAKAQLKAEWSAIFGRYFVALIMQAAFARAFIPPQQRRLALIHIDECHEYLDENVEQLLIQGRKYAIALHLYHQHMKQMQEKGLRETALSIPAIRYTGSLNDADAQLLAKETNTTPDFLKAVHKTNRGTEWSVYVRNLTPTAVRFASAVPRGRAPTENVRRRLSTPARTQPPTRRRPTPPGRSDVGIIPQATEQRR